AILSATNPSRTFTVQTVPGAPGATATASGTTVTVSWTTPASGGTPITGYVLRHRKVATPAVGWTVENVAANVNSMVLSGLSQSTKYEAQAAAANDIGTGSFSSVVSATTHTTPSVPTALKVTSAVAGLSVSWSAPANGGSPITGYVVRYSPSAGGAAEQQEVTGTSTTLTGLPNGASYAVAVAAKNIVGTGSFTAPTQGSTANVPGAPTIKPPTAGNAQASVSWTAPVSNGGSAITGYTVTASPGDQSCTATGTSCTVTGLANGTAYSFTVTAKNAVGVGPASDASVAVVPVGPAPPAPTVPKPSAPGAPGSISATRANAAATVSWAAPASNGGSAITKYTVTSSPGAKTCVTTGALSCAVTGLTNGTSYTFTVKAANAAGTGPSSGASAKIVPATRSSVVRSLTAKFPKKSVTTLTWSAPSSTGGAAITRYEYRIAPKSGKPWSKWISVKAARTATLKGHKKGKIYLVEVRAVNGAGASSAVRIKVKPSK
ncbi:MAG: large repetitive protein, partial [Actinomycetota bacterium]|nr:large repetitive protein [Actinomycetota bacterium]